MHYLVREKQTPIATVNQIGETAKTGITMVWFSSKYYPSWNCAEAMLKCKSMHTYSEADLIALTGTTSK